MTHPARLVRFPALFAALVLAAGGAVAASVTEELAVGAVMVANAKLFANPDDPAGLDLLRFALALDPENRDALLMQAKVDRKQKLDDVQLADGGKQYSDYVLNVAKQTRSRKRRLLLYKVVELVAPKNEVALLELTKAKNKGTDTSFGSLLQVMLPNAPKTDGDGDDEEEGKETGKPATNEDVFAVLEGISYQRGYSYALSDPTYALNNLNAALMGRRLSVRYESKKNPLRENRGMSQLYYSPAEAAWPAPSCPELVYYFSSELRDGNRTYADWVRLVCAWHNLGWRSATKGIAIVDPDHKEAEKGSGVPVLADVLVTTNKEGRLDFREKYYEKRLFVYGYVSGVSKDFVHLVHDQVRLDFASGTDAARIQALSADYTESKRDATGKPGGVLRRHRHLHRGAHGSDHPGRLRGLLLVRGTAAELARATGCGGGRSRHGRVVPPPVGFGERPWQPTTWICRPSVPAMTARPAGCRPGPGCCHPTAWS